MATNNGCERPPSPKSPTALLSGGQLWVATGGSAPATGGIAVRHLSVTTTMAVGRSRIDGANHVAAEVTNHHADPGFANGGIEVLASLEGYKKCIVPIVEEYFSTADVESTACELKNLGLDQYHQYFVKKLISIAMDRRDREKELASVLLSALYTDLISSSKINEGFMMLLESVEDLAVDIPDALNVLAVFIARAVTDDILPPIFVAQARELLPESSKGVTVLRTAEKSFLRAPHHAEFLERRWGGSPHKTVEEVKKKIQNILKEYIETGDKVEACRCIRELAVPFFHHEVVKRALILRMENPVSGAAIRNLLKAAAEGGLISSDQMAKGFLRVAESLDDLTLDVPSAKILYDTLASEAISDEYLDPNFRNLAAGNGELQNESNNNKVQEYKGKIADIILEYFLSDDIPELITSLEELDAPKYNPYFLKKLIMLAMDRKNREKEMASVLLSALSAELFSISDVIKGFVMLLQSTEDTSLDILDASDELALFLARAVIDEVLAPHNLDDISSRLRPNSSGCGTVQKAHAVLSARHSGERILRCWGGGTGWAVEDAKDKIMKLLEEYVSGGDLGEACQCIRDLRMPFFNHEVVKKALVMAMEKQKGNRILALLQECFNEGLVTINQMSKGFSRVQESLDDLTLDIPSAAEEYKGYVEHAKKLGWLSTSFGAPPAILRGEEEHA